MSFKRHFFRKDFKHFVLFVGLFFALFSAKAQEPKASKGKLILHTNFPSKLVEPRTVTVWLPENYDTKTKYAVLYMHDGQMLFDSTTTWNKQEWGIDETLQKLMDENAVRPTIVVGIYNNGEKRRYEYMPQAPMESLPLKRRNFIAKALMPSEIKTVYEWNADAYLKFIVKELKPFIDKNYSTSSDKANTFIGGSSFGGMISWYVACKYPKVFGGALCLSTHWPASFPNNPFTDLADACINYFGKNFAFGRTKIYFDHGTETLDAYYEPYQKRVDLFFEQRKINHETWQSLKFVGTDHSEKAWKERLEFPLRFILENRKH